MMYPDDAPAVLPPQSKEAEESLIGAALLNPSDLVLIGYLTEGDFYFGAPRLTWRAIQQLLAAKMPVDFVTVSEKLKESGDLEGVGGAAGLAALINVTPTSFNLDGYARIIKEKSRRRAILEQAKQLAIIAYDETQPVDARISTVMDNVVNCARPADKTLRHISHGLGDLCDFVEKRIQDPRDVWGIPSGFTDIDYYLGGQHLGEVFYIAGEPGVGKTRLAIQMALQAALPREENGSHPVGIFSFEMQEIEIIKRLVSGRNRVTTWEMNSGKMNDEKIAQFYEDVAYLEQLPIYTCDKSMNPDEFHADLFKHIQDEGIELYVLDYLMLMEGYENFEEHTRIAMLSRKIKRITQELGIAGITVSSVTKDVFGETGVPSNKSMRGSAQVVHDADTIAFMTACTDPGKQNIVTLTFTKTRTIARPVSQLYLVADNQYPIFHNATTKDINLDTFK